MLAPLTSQKQDTLPFDLGRFILKRHVPPGLRFFEATDHLMGTDEYGTFVDDLCAPLPFSVPFGTNYSTVCLINGACNKWVILSRDVLATYGDADMTGTPQTGHDDNRRCFGKRSVPVLGTYLKPFPHNVTMVNRKDHPEDPWIGAVDHDLAVITGDLLYGGNSFRDNRHSRSLHQFFLGLNVLVDDDRGGDSHLPGEGLHYPIPTKYVTARVEGITRERLRLNRMVTDCPGQLVIGTTDDHDQALHYSSYEPDELERSRTNMFTRFWFDPDVWRILITRPWPLQAKIMDKFLARQKDSGTVTLTKQGNFTSCLYKLIQDEADSYYKYMTSAPPPGSHREVPNTFLPQPLKRARVNV